MRHQQRSVATWCASEQGYVSGKPCLGRAARHPRFPYVENSQATGVTEEEGKREGERSV